MPGYITELMRRRDQRPKVPVEEPDCLAWGVPVRGVWVPFLMASNAAGETDIPAKALATPLRQRCHKDGTTAYRVNGRLAADIRIIRENFIAALSHYAATVRK